MGAVRRLKHASGFAAILLSAAVRLNAAPQVPAGGAEPQPYPATASGTIVCYPEADETVPPADAIQTCIDRAPAFSAVEIPAGKYVLHRQILISTPMTLRTAAREGAASCVAAPDGCAVLTGSPDLLDQWGLLVVRSTAHVRLEHLVIDGNRAARTTSEAGRICAGGNNSYGYNASVLECEECSVEDVVSMNALCGTGMVWTGAQATIEHNAFVSNGDAATQNMWSDGVTALYAPRSTIRENRFENNSDVALIIGFGAASRIERNVIVQRAQPAFAGLMLDNFNSSDLSIRGDFRDAVIADNTIDCGPQLCTFGIQVGPRPWYPTANIIGGEVHDNAVKGAKIGINVDGAGDRRAPTAIFSNAVEPSPRGSYFLKCAQPIPAEWMNIAPTSLVDRRNEETKVGSHLSDPCQLWSELSQ